MLNDQNKKLLLPTFLSSYLTTLMCILTVCTRKYPILYVDEIYKHYNAISIDYIDLSSLNKILCSSTA